MTTVLKISSLAIVAYLITGCSTDKQFRAQLEKTLSENPEIVFKTIQNNPAKFMSTLEVAARSAKEDMAKQAKVRQEKQLEDSFSNPLSPEISSRDVIKGPKDAPITIVEYSDFECPFCARGFNTVTDIMNKYPGKVRFIYKHLPLSFHPSAMLSAQYYEAIALQSPRKAMKFHDMIFAQQAKLKMGEAFLTKLAKELKVDLLKLKKDINSDQVASKIEADISEAKKFGMSGTPGFIINGIPVKGAYPAEYFDEIISKLKTKGKLIL
jgi:protein-disulfide isomerase